MINIILKWLGFKTIKGLLVWLATSYVVTPVVRKLGDWFQELINDPNTDLDENFTEDFVKYSDYAIRKKLNKL